MRRSIACHRTPEIPPINGLHPGTTLVSVSPFAQPVRMVRLMTADDGFTAKVVAARLGVEGIVWELRGGVDGPYPFGPVHVFVPESDLAEAQALLAATAPLEEELGDGEDEEARAAAAQRRSDRRALLVGAGVLGLLALASAEIVRVLVLR
jgi:hypothetical protein